MPGDITANPFPKKKQGSKLALILSHDKRTAQLQRRSEPVEKIRLIMKECARVQSSRASFGDNLRTSPHAICPGDSLLPLIPKNDMAIIVVKKIQISAGSGSLANLTKRNLP